MSAAFSPEIWSCDSFKESEKDISNSEEPVLKSYKRRFWMLFLFSFLSFLCGMMYPQYYSMANVTGCYYNVTQVAVNWTSMMFMVVYVIFFLPASALMNYIDLKWTLILGSFFNTAGCALQFASLKPDSFPFVLLSTFITSLASLFIWATPPFLAVRWFPSNESSRACSFGLVWNQLGAGFGFIFSPLMVSSDCTKKEAIEAGKWNIACYLTSVNVAVFILIITTFQNAPKFPPNYVEVQKKSEVSASLLKTVLKMMKNIHFILILMVYGALVGSLFAIGTTLNSLILHYFPNKIVEIGWMGLIFTVTGQFGCAIAGYVLDYTHRFKETFIGIIILSLVCYVLFSALLYVKRIWIQYLTIGVLGFFLSSIFPVGIEYGIEVTHPDSEIISASLLNASTQLFGIILTEVSSNLLEYKGPISSNATFCITFLICSIAASFLTTDYKRSKQSSVKTSSIQ